MDSRYVRYHTANAIEYHWASSNLLLLSAHVWLPWRNETDSEKPQTIGWPPRNETRIGLAWFLIWLARRLHTRPPNPSFIALHTRRQRVIKPENARTKWNWDFFPAARSDRENPQCWCRRGENRTQINPPKHRYILAATTISVRISIKTTHASKSLSEIEFIIKLNVEKFPVDLKFLGRGLNLTAGVAIKHLAPELRWLLCVCTAHALPDFRT